MMNAWGRRRARPSRSAVVTRTFIATFFTAAFIVLYATPAHASFLPAPAAQNRAGPLLPGPGPGGDDGAGRILGQRRRARARFFQFDLEFIEDIVRCALCVVDGHGAILLAAKRAQAILSAGCGIRVRAGCLQIERAHLDRTVQAIIRRVTAGAFPSESTPSADAVGIPDREGRTRYALRVLPFPMAEGPPLALIAIADLVEGAGLRAAAIADIFRLTRREAELAALFASGCDLEQIAALMRVSPNTARVHLRHVLAKTGSANQLQLARILARVP